MAKNKLNVAQIVESWTPAIKQITKNRVNESNPERLEWMCQYAHNHSMHLNEDYSPTGGASFPFQTLFNTNGIGNAVPASYAGHTAVDQTNPASYGSGDKWPALLPMALQVAARTIGFDLINNFPLQGPTGVLPFLDYIYSGSKEAYGATPAHNRATANPKYAPGKKDNNDFAFLKYEAPFAFRCVIATKDASKGDNVTKEYAIKSLDNATSKVGSIKIGTADASMNIQFIGLSRLNAQPMLKVMPESKTTPLASIFEEDVTSGDNYVTVTITAAQGGVIGKNTSTGEDIPGDAKFRFKNPHSISALEDQILGYTGSGKFDNERWSGTFQDPHHLYEPMDRATGEMQYPRQMSLKVFTKFFSVGTMTVSVAVTQEQVQDLQKQWGIDVLKLVENAGINELSQDINKHILSRLFANGWKNHVLAYEAEGINLNLDLTKSYDPTSTETVSFVTYSGEDGENPYEAAMPINGYKTFGTFENADTVYKKIGVNMLAAGNLVMQRGRRGAANFIVTNWKVATMLQSNAQYSFSPIANTFNQNNGSLYPTGTIAGMTLYVDPLMHTQDTRVLVGRKGDKDEPGIAFCPYILAESIKLISEHTASPKVLIKSRYGLVDMGWYPFLNYVTFYVKTPEGII